MKQQNLKWTRFHLEQRVLENGFLTGRYCYIANMKRRKFIESTKDRRYFDTFKPTEYLESKEKDLRQQKEAF